MSAIEIPRLCLVVLVGVSGAGKSTFAHRHFRDSEVLSSDVFRGILADDPTDQSATSDAFEVLHDIAGRRLRRGLLTVIDATSLRPEDRAGLLALAKEHDVFAVAIVLDVPLAELRQRAADRDDIDDGVLRRQHTLLRRHGKNLRKEGFRFVYVLDGVDEIDTVTISPTRLFNDLTDEHGPFDIIGDVHGCFGELCELLEELGATIRSDPSGTVLGVHDHPEGRRVVFVGDLVDRGPDTPAVLALVMSMVAAGQAICVRGNHEEKLLRALRQRRGGRPGRAITLSHGLAESIAQLEACPDDFVDAVVEFLDGLVSHYVLDGGRLVVAHAGLAQRYHGRSSGRVRNLATYGETTGRTDRWGFPERLDWARDYRGDAVVVYGHTPVTDVAWVNNTLCIDTGCVFGGRLTALRYPESEIRAVPADRVYWHSDTVTGYGDSDADARMRTRLRLDDVVGKRSIRTGFGPAVTIREENAAPALEVMSRFAIDPRWIRYLPPTMSPVGSESADLLEDPAAAFSFYAGLGVEDVICEHKHMGSRAVLVVVRDDDTARRVFGVAGAGAIHTRTGRSFFGSADTDEMLVRARRAGESVFDRFGWSWMILDAEILPWNIKGEGLVRERFASVAAAATAELDLLAAELAAVGHRLDLGDRSERLAARRRDVDAFTASYLDHVQVGATVSDVRIAAFEVLAAGGAETTATFENRSHAWHLEVADALAEADSSLFAPTARMHVSTSSSRSRDAGAAWWTELTASGGEGMVVKPAANLVRDTKGGLVPPGVKVRGREYLRIIYGPSYTDDLDRLRSRDLRHKRSMAMREYQLGREALARHARGAPLWKVHECVFAVLALETEKVDSRL
ncbi:polynucleotide kinase-phosphatase [Gordonia bronchialis]|uniref:polynucleotide kinase-phosphatase n=1 Tax=Gordonia bronchialis TaxID=2054 RepID=UPI00226EAEFC|nr:polynucleotide kinase-phosphatase [Gordonia bronchialis]